ncbi:MAG: 30S ribosomal protein S6 [Candidatus Omnitrophota bacterium]|jgi:ribosomal protein S6
MKVYEGIFIFPPDVTPEALKKQEKVLEDTFQKFGGTVVQKTEFGKKTLGYEIRKYRDGLFFVYDFRMDPSRMQELTKTLNLQEGLLKYTVLIKGPTVVKAAPAKPAVVTETVVPAPAGS